VARWSTLARAAAGLVPWALAPRATAADCAVASAGGASARAGCDDDSDVGIGTGLLARSAAPERPILATSDDGCTVAQAGGAVARSGCDADDDLFASAAARPARPQVIAIDNDPAPLHVAKPTKVAKPPPESKEPKDPKGPKSEEPDPLDGPPADRPGGAGAQGNVTVELDCESNPETTAVTNNGAEPIRVQEIDSLVEDAGGEPFARDDLVRPGRTVTYETGDEASGRFALGGEIYRNGDPDEGVRIATSGGEAEAFCFVS
jgi:hypothetical protein